MEKIKFLPLCDNFELPQYETKGAANFDLRVHFKSVLNGAKVPTILHTSSSISHHLMTSKYDIDELVLNPGDWAVIPLGFAIELPENRKMEIYSRSGLAAKYNISVINAPGQIDSDYRGCVCVIISNEGKLPYTIIENDRICQAAIVEVTKDEFMIVDNLSKTDRNTGGFGHTGVK